ncbi:MAG: translation initiation factor [Thermaurantimonas sp.]
MKRNKNKEINDQYAFAYSTKSNVSPFDILATTAYDDLDKRGQTSEIVELHFEVKGRNGKPVTIVKNVPSELGVEKTASSLKKLLNTGGSVKNGEIILQGDRRKEISLWFASQNIKTKYVGG